MNTRRTIALVFLLFLSTSAMAQRTFGLGAILGEPTGISGKYWLNDSRAIDGGVAWSFSSNPSLQIHGDYLIHRTYRVESGDSKTRIPVYFGIGGRLKLRDSDARGGRNHNNDLLGARFPVGVSKMLRDDPVEFFLEIVPILDLIPDTDFAINAAIGARYYF